MSDFKKLNLNGTEYSVKDETARNSINELSGEINTLSGEINTLSGKLADDVETINNQMNVNKEEVNTEIGLLNNGIAESNNNIEKIKNMLSMYDINLTNHIIYDLVAGQYNQGMCVDENNNMYVYVNKDNTVGDLLIFDITTYTLKNKIENIQLYHGGDLCYINGALYSIGNYVNMLIVRYDLTSGIRTELNPFHNIPNFTQTLGLTKLDDENLLCLVGYLNGGESNIHDFATTGLYKVNINTLEIEQIAITNTNNFYLNNYCFQSMEFYDNKLYILMSYPNMIVELLYDETLNTFNINKLYNIPTYDKLGQAISEVQGISKIWSNKYGKTSFMLTTIVVDYNIHTMKAYVFDINSNTQELLSRLDINASQLSNPHIVCDSEVNPTIYYENGSEEYPFKTIRRAIAFANYSPLAQGKQVRVRRGTYYLGIIKNCEAVIGLSDEVAGTINFEGEANITNSNVKFIGAKTGLVNFNGRVNFDGGEADLRKLTFNDVIQFKNGHGSILDCDFTETGREVIILIGENAIVKSSAATFSNEQYYYYVDRYSVAFLSAGVPDNKIMKNGRSWIIKSS